MRRITSMLKSVLGGIQKIESTICFIGILITTVLIFAQVVNRYWLHFEIMWLSDLALYCFIFFMFIAAAIATWREGHVAVDFFRERIVAERPLRAAMYHLVLNLIALIVLCIFIPIAYGFMVRAIKYPQYGTLVRWFNESWLQITVFFAMALVLLHLLVIIRRDIMEIKRLFLERSRRRGD